jgi:hypothetical protein
MAAPHRDKHKVVHHLSARNQESTGWIESISSLTEENPATKLLLQEEVIAVKVMIPDCLENTRKLCSHIDVEVSPDSL